MRPEESPFPCCWWGISLKEVGLGTVRPNVGTYGQYDFAKLPALPFQMNGRPDWLAAAPSYDESIGERNAQEMVAIGAIVVQQDRGTAGLSHE